MKTLKTFGAAIALMFVLAVAAFAGETLTPPCAPPEPGQTNTPPCASAQMTTDDAVPSGQTTTLPPSNAGDEYSVSEVAIDLIQHWLSIF